MKVFGLSEGGERVVGTDLVFDREIEKQETRCWKLKCLLGFDGCQTRWLGEDRQHLFAVCAKCGKPRVYLGTMP